MFIYDRVSKTKLGVPGKFDWDLLLEPVVAKFMANVSDTSVIVGNNWNVLPTRKKRVGYWYTQEDLSDTVTDHGVRLVPAFCDQTLVHSSDTEALAYPIPLFSSGEWVKTLFVLISGDCVTAEFHDVHTTEELVSLSDVLLSSLTQEGAGVNSLTWIQDERNHMVPSPEDSKTYNGDMLEYLLKNISQKLHVFTENEKVQESIKKKQTVLKIGMLVVLLFILLIGSNVFKEKEREKKADLLKRQQGLQTALLLQSREEQVYDLLAHAMKKQPDYSAILNRLYSGTTTLTHKNIVLKLKTVGKNVYVKYMVEGLTFVKLADIRPELKKDMAGVGVAIDGAPVIIPKQNMIPEILVSGHFKLVENN